MITPHGNRTMPTMPKLMTPSINLKKNNSNPPASGMWFHGLSCSLLQLYISAYSSSLTKLCPLPGPTTTQGMPRYHLTSQLKAVNYARHQSHKQLTISTLMVDSERQRQLHYR